MKIYVVTLLFLVSVYQSYAQDSVADNSPKLPTTIVNEFDAMVEEAGNYQEYKVVKKEALAKFKINLAERRDTFEAEIDALGKEIVTQNKEITDLKKQLLETQNQLTTVEEQKSSMQLLGNNVDKTTFQTIVFAIIGVLLLMLLLVSIKFKANSAATNEAKDTLESTEKEFEEYKRKALEKQQVLGRQLQDEKNKVSKLKASGLK